MGDRSIHARRFGRGAGLVVALILLSLLLAPVRGAAAQESGLDQLLAQMGPRERVAQLFLVTFDGQSTDAGSMAERLVRDLRVGGVALRASNRNYTSDPGSAEALRELTTGLQRLAFEASAAAGGDGPFVPVFVAIDLYSRSPLFADGIPEGALSELPSEMSIGATWSPENAGMVGQIVGAELRATGVNMLLGPELAVVDAPRPGQTNTIGTQTFGGDPYWVGEMGRLFVRGVAEGSGGSVATVARHFPGLGSSDRRPDEEIATVQKPLQALQQEDLPPFFAVTSVEEMTGTVDGLMTTNLRYRGLQGNIRQITRPISLDAQSLPTLLDQPELLPWREAGGILVSDELGAPALRRFYRQQTNSQSFPALIVAEDAFKAGNDLLFLADFALEDDWEARLSNIEATLNFFAELYSSDPAFAAEVDTSVRRLLALKLSLYNGELERALAPEPPEGESLEPTVRRQEHLNELARIAQESATLLFPGEEELADRLPAPPLADEEIVIVTDARTIRDCAECPPRPIIAVDALERAMVARYGPTGGAGRLDPERVRSFSFEQMMLLLDGGAPSGESEALRAALDEADWLLFLMQDISPEQPSSEALRRYLRELVNGQTRDQRLIVFSFAAPYYLDSTEISKVTAYYGFYTPSRPFVDAAARLLFKEYSATGSPPVSIYPRYALEAQLSPAPDQVVEICRDAAGESDGGCAPLLDDDVQAGGELALRTTVIRDRNGNPVPDGTVVNFIMRYPNENNLELPRQQALTRNGIARAVVPLNREGQLNISVTSEPPTFTSATVLVTIEGEAPPVVATQLPPTATPAPTVTPSPEPSPTPRPTRTAAPAPPTPTATPEALTRFGEPNEGFGWWTLMVTLVGLVAVGGLGVARATPGRARQVRRALRVFVFGLGGYLIYLLFYAFRLTPADFNGWGAIFIALVAASLSLIGEE